MCGFCTAQLICAIYGVCVVSPVIVTSCTRAPPPFAKRDQVEKLFPLTSTVHPNVSGARNETMVPVVEVDRVRTFETWPCAAFSASISAPTSKPSVESLTAAPEMPGEVECRFMMLG